MRRKTKGKIMKTKPLGLSAGLGLALIGLSLSPATANASPPPISGYTFQTVDYPGKDFNSETFLSQDTFISNSGLIVQQYTLPGDPVNYHSAVFDGNKWTVIDVPGAVHLGGCTNPNSQGQIVVGSAGTDGIWHLAIWQRGHFTFVPDLPPRYVIWSWCGINDRGQVTGALLDSETGDVLGYVWDVRDNDRDNDRDKDRDNDRDSHRYRLFAYPGSHMTFAYQTNNAGITVGTAMGSEDGLWHPFIFDGKQFATNIDLSRVGLLDAINNEGDIVGTKGLFAGDCVGWLLVNGTWSELVHPNALQTTPYSINDNHQIAGTYQAADGTVHGFIATPLEYTLETVDYPDKDLSDYMNQITFMNNSGLIVQQYVLPGSVNWHTAVFNGKEWTVIDVPGSVQTGCTNPNSRGQIALIYAGADKVFHLAIWQRGHFTLLPDLPGYAFSTVNGLNDRGQVSGAVTDSTGVLLGLVMDTDRDNHRDNDRDNDQYWVFAAPGSEGVTWVLMTNNSGITVGTSLQPDGFKPFIFDGKQFLDFDAPGVAVFNFINNEGDMVGGRGYFAGNAVGFLYVKGTWSDFNLANALQTTPWCITDKDQISGTYQAADGTCHGFIATPKHGPEHCPK